MRHIGVTNSRISPSETDSVLRASSVPDAANEEEMLWFAAFEKPKYSSAHRNAPSRSWCWAVWPKNYSILPVHVFSADPIEFHLLRFVSVFSKFVRRDWYADDARKFQPVDEIMIPLSIQLLALNAPLLSIR